MISPKSQFDYEVSKLFLFNTEQFEEDLLNVNSEIENVDNNIKQLSQAAESMRNELDQFKVIIG